MVPRRFVKCKTITFAIAPGRKFPAVAARVCASTTTPFFLGASQLLGAAAAKAAAGGGRGVSRSLPPPPQPFPCGRGAKSGHLLTEAQRQRQEINPAGLYCRAFPNSLALFH